jgi:peptide-methionine (S)-S-oxide reductase
MFLFGKSSAMPTPESALPGRPEPILDPAPHHANGRPIAGPYPDGTEIAELAFGCFWGAEKGFWQLPGVWVTAVGYQGGFAERHLTRRPAAARPATPRRSGSCSTSIVSYEELLKHFWRPRPDPRDAPGQRRRDAMPIRDLPHTDAQRACGDRLRAAYQAPPFGRRIRQHHDRDFGPTGSRVLLPRTTTSSI